MVSKSDEIHALREQMNKVLQEHTVSLSRKLDELLATALERPKPESGMLNCQSHSDGVIDPVKPLHAVVNSCDPNVENRSSKQKTINALMSESQLEEFVASRKNWFEGGLVYWSSIKEPPRTGHLAKLVNSKGFDAFTVLVISIQTIYTILETDWQMRNLTVPPTEVMVQVDLLFTCVYALEITLRLAAHRCYFFCNHEARWNIFDLFIVVAGIADAIANRVNSSTLIANPSVLRFVRVFRVAQKILRVVRLLEFFSELRLMAKCLVGSGSSLFWSFILLFGFTVIVSVLVVQQFATCLANQSGQLDALYISQVQQNFGSVQRAVLSLFMCISGGNDWDEYYQIVKASGTLNSMIFLTYILLVWLSITNIIISIFVDRAMKLAQPDVDERLLARRKGDLELVKEIKSLFNSMDVNNSGTVSADELQRCIKDVRLASYFEIRGLDVKDAEGFYELLSSMSGNGEVDVHTFVEGWLKMKGQATSLDLYIAQYQTHLMSKKVRSEIALCRQDVMRWETTLQKDLSLCSQNVMQLRQELTQRENPNRQIERYFMDQNMACSQCEQERDMASKTSKWSECIIKDSQLLGLAELQYSVGGDADQEEISPKPMMTLPPFDPSMDPPCHPKCDNNFWDFGRDSS